MIKLPQLPYPSRTGINSKNEIYVLDGSQRRIVRLTPEGRFKDYLEPVGLPQPVSYVPRSFHIDMNDNIYILDIFSERVLILDPDGQYRRSIKFPKNYGFFSDVTVDFRGDVLLVDSVNAVVFTAGKGSPRFAQLTESLKEYVRFPASLASDNRGRIYLLDHNGGSIIVLGQDGSFLERQLGFGWKEGLLNEPSQLCMDNEGEMFIADTNNDRVQIFATAD